MLPIKFSATARADLAEMSQYGTHHWGRARAHKFLEQFIADLDVISLNPRIGTADGDLHQFSFGQYKVYYSVYHNEIIIRTIEPKGKPRYPMP